LRAGRTKRFENTDTKATKKSKTWISWFCLGCLGVKFRSERKPHGFYCLSGNVRLVTPMRIKRNENHRQFEFSKISSKRYNAPRQTRRPGVFRRKNAPGKMPEINPVCQGRSYEFGEKRRPPDDGARSSPCGELQKRTAGGFVFVKSNIYARKPITNPRRRSADGQPVCSDLLTPKGGAHRVAMWGGVLREIDPTTFIPKTPREPNGLLPRLMLARGRSGAM